MPPYNDTIRYTGTFNSMLLLPPDLMEVQIPS